MTDARHIYDGNNITAEDVEETFASVKNYLKDFGEKSATATNDDDDTFVSVKDRLRRFDSRQDDEDCDNDERNQSRVQGSSTREFSIGSITVPGKSSTAVYGPMASSPLTTSTSFVTNHSSPVTPLPKFVQHKTPTSTKASTPLASLVTNESDINSSPPFAMSLILGDEHTDESSSSLKENSSKEVFQYGNVLLKKVEKPVEDKWKIIASESDSEVAEMQRKVEDLLKKVEKPIEDKWKRKNEDTLTDATETRSRAQDLLRKVEKPIEDRWKRNRNLEFEASNERLKQKSLLRTKSESKKDPTSNQKDFDLSKSLHKKVFQKTSPSTSDYNKPQSLNSRSTSLPMFSGMIHDQSTLVREEKYRNDLAAALKKVGLPVEDKWKSMKNSDEDVSDTSSKPVFATMKLRSVGTPTENSTLTSGSLRFNEKRQYFDDQRTPDSAKQTFNFDEEDKKSDIAKRRRMPTRAGIVQASAICYGESGREKNSAKSNPHRLPTEGISVSDLAKTFSKQIKLASNGERAEEEKVTGTVTSKSHEIIRIRNTLKSSAKELEELRRALVLSTPVSKLIAERNKAAQANRSKDNLVEKMPQRRTKSIGGTGNSHRRTKSMSSIHTENSDADGRSVRVLASPSWRRNRDGDLVTAQSGNISEGDIPDDFSERWESIKANNIITESGDIWNLNLDDAFFNGNSNYSCPTKYHDDDISGSYLENSTLSDCTSASDGEFCHEIYGHSRYIQITLSSGGILEKFEPTIAMSPTESPTASDGVSMSYPMGYPTEESIDASFDYDADSKREKMNVLVPLKGAKKFFFRKNKRKSAPIEI